MTMIGGIADKTTNSIHYSITFVAGIAVGFSQSWQLTLVMFSAIPVLTIIMAYLKTSTVGFESKIAKAYAKVRGAIYIYTLLVTQESKRGAIYIYTLLVTPATTIQRLTRGGMDGLLLVSACPFFARRPAMPPTRRSPTSARFWRTAAGRRRWPATTRTWPLRRRAGRARAFLWG